MARPPPCASGTASSSSSPSLSASTAAWRRGSGAVERATKVDRIPRIAITTSIAISVNPRPARDASERPVPDVGVKTFSTKGPVRAIAEYVELAVQTWIQVLVGLAPRVHRQSFHIAPGLPVVRYGRLTRPGNQRLQSLLGRRVAFCAPTGGLDRAE